MIKHAAAVVVVAALAAPAALAQNNPRGEAKATVAGKNVSIEYGRPSLKGRDMLGQAPVGSPWRMGADGPTVLKADADLNFGGVPVPKGSYILQATKKSADQWVMNVHKPDPGSPRTPGEKVADVVLTPAKLDASVEQFTIDLKGDKAAGEFQMIWGTTALKAPFTAK